MDNSLAKAIKAKNDAQFRLNIRDRAPSINEGSGGGTVIVDPNNYTVPYAPGKNISFGVAGDQKVINAIMNLLKGDNISISAPDANGAVTISGTLGGKALDITNLVDGYVITYDTTSGKFILSEIPSSYQLPQATETILGGIKAKAKVGETSEIAIDPLTGKLYGPAPDAAANGLSQGGTAGQIPIKIDDIEYNTAWGDVNAKQLLTKPINIPDFTGKDGYILAYDEINGGFYLKADDGGGGDGIIQTASTYFSSGSLLGDMIITSIII